MKVNPSIFKSFDIRGVYPKELNEEAAYEIGRAFVSYTQAKEVVLARDCRIGSPSLFKEILRGITDSGADVIDIGETPTEGLYFTVGFYNYQSGIMVTASHSPKEYDGFKMVNNRNGRINIVRGKDLLGITGKNSEVKGEVKSKDIWKDFIGHIVSFADIGKIKPYTIAIDASNGMAAKVIPLLEKELPISVVPLNFNIDGNFPAHPPNPLMEDSKIEISKVIKEKRADFGFIFDGDADRIFIVDEDGELIRSDVTLVILAKKFLSENPGLAVVYNLICSKAVPEFIEKFGGKAVRVPVGFVNVMNGLIENNGIMGGELSGHFCFRDNYYLDSGFIAFVSLLQIISESGKQVRDLVKEFSPYAKASEINFEIENKDEIIKRIKEKYSDGNQDFLDGVTVNYSNWWFNVRLSQTEPLLRLTIEADNQELLEEKKKELEAIIVEQ